MTYDGVSRALALALGFVVFGEGPLVAHAADVVVGSGQTYVVTSNPETIGSLNIDAGGDVELGSNTLIVDDSGSSTWSGLINGVINVGYLNKVGTGTVTLSNLTATNDEIHIVDGTLVQSGTTNNFRYLAIGSGAGANATFNISGGTLNFSGDNSIAWPSFQVGDWGGTGVVNQTGGDVNITGAGFNIGNQGGNGTYNLSGGTMTVTDSAVIIGRSTSTSRTSVGVLNISGGELRVTGDSAFVIGNNLLGGAGTSGTVNQTGGILRYEGTGGYDSLFIGGYNDGTYNLDGGILQIGGGALQGTLYGGAGASNFNLGGGTIQVIGDDVLDTLVNATLVDGTMSTIDGSGVGVTWEGVLSGGGGLIKKGDDYLTLTAADTYSGTTEVEEGILAFSGNGHTANSTIDLAADGTRLRINDIWPSSTTIGGLAGVAGSEVDLGAKTLVFGGSADTTFDGNFNGDDGGIEKDGTGTFTFGGTTNYTGNTLIADGTLKTTHADAFPWTEALIFGTNANWDMSGAGRQSLLGTLQFGSGSTLSATLGNGSDWISSASTVSLAGALDIHGGDGKFDISTPYLLISSNGLTGTFATFSDDLPFLVVTPDYVDNDVYLDFTKSGTTIASIGATPNETSVGSALDNLDIGNPLFDQVAGLSAADALAALDTLQGDIHPSARSVLSQTATYVADAAEDRVHDALTDEVARGRGLWATAYGHALDLTDLSGNADDVRATNAGLVAGLDVGGENWLVGGGVGYASSSFSADAHRASATADGYTALVYAGANAGLFRFSGGGSFTANPVDTTRAVVLPDAETLAASYNARTVQAFGEAGLGLGAFEPFAGANYINVATDAFTESGGAAAIAGHAGGQSVTFTTLGVRAKLAAGNGVWVTGMAGWRHTFGDLTPSLAASLQGQAFSVAGVPLATDAFVMQAGFSAALSHGASIGLTYFGQVGSVAEDHGGKATATIDF